MKYKELLLIIAAIIIVCFYFISYTEPAAKEKSSTPPISTSEAQTDSTASQFPQIQSKNIEVKAFEVKDSTGKSQGWGYDLFVDNKKMIHQSIIPAIPGNNPFKTEKDAYKTGQFAADKMKVTGTLPTLSVKELDSLGITK